MPEIFYMLRGWNGYKILPLLTGIRTRDLSIMSGALSLIYTPSSAFMCCSFWVTCVSSVSSWVPDTELASLLLMSFRSWPFSTLLYSVIIIDYWCDVTIVSTVLSENIFVSWHDHVSCFLRYKLRHTRERRTTPSATQAASASCQNCPSLNQHTRELISARKTSHMHNNKVPSRLR